MSTLDSISKSLAAFYCAEPARDAVVVNTHCMYPSNTFVRVLVRGTESSCVVSDDWGAVREFADTGAESGRLEKMVASHAKKMGLKSDGGNIHSGAIRASDVAGAVGLVANASKEIARILLNTLRPARPEFKESLRTMLNDRFNGAVRHNVSFVGHSNKTHVFENVIMLPKARLIVDPVIHDHASINSRLVANLDVQRAGLEGVEQRLIYDDSDKWTGEEISLLRMGGPVVSFSNAPQVIGQLLH